MKAKKKRGKQSKQRYDSPVKKRRGGDESKEEEGRAKQQRSDSPVKTRRGGLKAKKKRGKKSNKEVIAKSKKEKRRG
jgi:hypothetical protein